MRAHIIANVSVPEVVELMLPAVLPPDTETIFHALPADAGSTFWPFHNSLSTLLQSIPADEALVLADWASAMAVSKRDTTERTMIHLASQLPSPKERSKITSYAAKPFTIHAASQTIADALVNAGVDSKRVNLTRPQYQIHMADANPLPTFMLGTACTLAPNQGLETVLQAMHDCRELLPQLKLVIIGDGPDKQRFLWLIDQLNLRGRVHIAATTKDYRRFLTNFDIFIAPNPTDSGCNPMIGHALALGVPVIASKLPSHEEIIKHNRTGLIYEAGNATMLAQHILNLYNHPDWMAHYKNIGPEALGSR